MTYEDADIFAFISKKSRPVSAPEKVTVSENETLSGGNSASKISPENEIGGGREKDLFKEISGSEESSDPATKPAFEELPPVPLPETVTETDIQNPSGSDSKAFSSTFSDASELSGLSRAVPAPASSFYPEDSYPADFSEKEELPFETFEDYDFGVSRAPPPSLVEAFGIVTTGIEPLEITPSAATITGYIASARRSEIRLGTYVVVPYEDGEKLFARVGKLQYRQEFAVDDATEIHSRRMLNARASPPINEADYKFLACLDPLCILYHKRAEGSLTRRMADRIPRPNTPILPVTDRLEVQTGLNIPEEGIFLGHLSVGGELVKTHSEPETVAYYLRNDYSMGDPPLIFRHMLICGSTGTGKTFLSKNILRQFMTESNRYRLRNASDNARKNPCLVIMDPQDEYSQIFEDNETLTDDDRFRFESENVACGRSSRQRLLWQRSTGRNIPETSRGQSRSSLQFLFPLWNTIPG